MSRRNGKRVHDFFLTLKDTDTEALGFYQHGGRVLNGEAGELRPFEVHSVRPVRRIGPDGQQRTDLVVEITQSWLPADGRGKFRGGCTLIIDMEKKTIRYVVANEWGTRPVCKASNASKWKWHRETPGLITSARRYFAASRLP